MNRRFAALGVAVGLGLAGGAAWTPPPAEQARRIPVSLRKFEFEPTLLTAREGETVTFVLSSLDFVHGFGIPELGLRVDVPPGRTIEVGLQLESHGCYTMLCDNFCGDGHDKMTGWLVVLASRELRDQGEPRGSLPPDSAGVSQRQKDEGATLR